MSKALEYAAILAFFLFWILPVQSQEFQIRQFTPTDGLASSRINALLQDSRGFIWLGTGSGLQYYDGYRFRTYEHIPGYDQSLRDNYVRALYEDPSGRIWVGTDSGLQYFDWTTESFTYIPYSESSGELPDYSVTDIYGDRNGNLWLGTFHGLFRLDREKNEMVRVLDQHGQGCPGIEKSSCIREGEDGKIWLGTSAGLLRYDPVTQLFTSYINESLPKHSIESDAIESVHQHGQDHLLIGTSHGLFVFDQKELHFHSIQVSSGQNATLFISAIAESVSGIVWLGSFGQGLYSLERGADRQQFQIQQIDFPSVRIKFLLPDDHGNWWVGTYASGLYQLSPGLPVLRIRPPGATSISASGNIVRSFFERPDGKIWVGVDGGGIHLFDPETQTFSNWKQPDQLSKSRVYSIIQDRTGRLWAGTRGKGLHWFDPVAPEHNYRHFDWLSRNEVVYEDRYEDIWVICREVFFRYIPRTDSIIYYRQIEMPEGPFKNTAVWCLFEDHHDNLWVGTENGLYFYDRPQDAFTLLQCNTRDPSELMVWALTEDHEGRLWAGGKKGLYLLDPIEKCLLKSWNKQNGMPEQLVQGIVEDNLGYLWISTEKGLYRFDPKTEKFQEFGRGKAFELEKYNSRAAFKSRSGILFFGHQHGFEMIYPEKIRDNKHEPPIAITNFRLAYQDVPIADSPTDTGAIASPLNKHIAATDEIILEYWQNNFSFEFAALDFIDARKNRYRYKLEPYHEAWVETEADQRQAVFTNLSPGKYRFHVIGSNNDDHWNLNGDFVDITIRHPWWATPLAYIIYVSATLGLLLIFYRSQLKRKLAAAEALRLQELDVFKTQLYTNITHEFRTPLTVILGMADRLGKKALKKQKDGLAMIKRNGWQLLGLVNQMLALRKVESGHMPIILVQAEVLAYLQYLCASFHPLAEQKDINIHFHSELPELVMDFDPEKLKAIISNLLSNAIKFTPVGGAVRVAVSQSIKDVNSLEIRVIDNGIGIPTDQLPFVFDRFYQINKTPSRAGQGTGIGLTLIKELVKLHGGNIDVESNLGEGSQFTVYLPITQNAPLVTIPFTQENWNTPLPFVMPSEVEFELAFGEGSGPIALLIEDNPDVVRYLKLCLEENYQVISTFNGREGIEVALEKIPDIIISDVMMPEKDGYEVCDTLKNDERTSHIPIILLTAKADAKSRIKGLQKGADAYLAKPFNEQELQVRLEKLIELRRKLRRRYQNLKEFSATVDPVFVKEDAFLLKLREIIEAHLIDTSFGPTSLTTKIGLSHSQLFRKIKSLTGKSIASYIRLIRLQNAEDLLKKSDLNISEIAYQVGFNDPAYFSRSFQKEFGKTPSAWRED